MSVPKEFLKISPLPLVDLQQIEEPTNGLLLPLNKTCKKNFRKGSTCHEYYERLASDSFQIEKPIQCPYGFASVPLRINGALVAITSIIPYPRLGGKGESLRAKQHPETKFSIESLGDIIVFLQEAYEQLSLIQVKTIQNQSMALHEIRKLNRTIKQTAERLYEKDKTNELFQILKTSELMSAQFDIIEILANESLAELKRNSIIEVYRIFDKCVHIYQTNDQRIKLYSTTDYYPEVSVCDKTFPIIPTVLIENALKYSIPDTLVKINIDKVDDKCSVSVSNSSKGKIALSASIFQRGKRFSIDTEGSGNGLYVAQLIAKQHGTRIEVECAPSSNEMTRVTFRVLFETSKK